MLSRCTQTLRRVSLARTANPLAASSLFRRPHHVPHAAASRCLCSASSSSEDASPRPAPISAYDDPGPVPGAADDAFLVFQSPTYARMVNMIMKDGKKATARRLLLSAFEQLRAGGHDPQDIFYSALDNARPMMEMKHARAGAIPMPLMPKRAEGQAMKWIINAARKRPGIPFDRSLAQELLAAHQQKGGAVSRREQVHKEAVANQAAAHFRWRASSTRTPAGSIDMDRPSYRPKRRQIKHLQRAFAPEKPGQAAP